MKTLFTLLILFTCLFINAQEPTFKWAKSISGSGTTCYSDRDYKAIKTDQNKNVYVIGTFHNSITIENGFNPVTLTTGNDCSGYLIKYDSLGNYVWSHSIGGTDMDEALGVEIDNQNNVYVTGRFASTVDFDPGIGTDIISNAGVIDVYLTKFDENGNYLWTKTMGGNYMDIGNNVTLDANGNIYLTGRFSTTADFDPGPGVANLVSNGNGDIFICKLDQNGNYIWAKGIGGSSTSIADEGYDIAIDPTGNVYLTGWFRGTVDFDPDVNNIVNLIPTGSSDAFICKLNASGNFVWAKKMGGVADDCGRNIALDVQGNIYTSGYFSGSADFDPGTATFNLNAVNSWDVYVHKIDADGNFIWAKSFGGAGSDKPYGMEMDEQANIYITGSFLADVDFDPDLSADSVYTLISGGVNDAFITKLDSSGHFIWAERLGSTGEDFGYSVTTDNAANVYATGTFVGSADFDPDGIAVFNLESPQFGIYVFKWDNGNEMTTGLSDQSMENIVIYPNPTTGILHLKGLDLMKTDKLLVYDQIGRFMASFDPVSTLDLSHFSSGIYQLQIVGNFGSRPYKIHVNQ